MSKRYTLGIFSQGDARLQRNKLEKTSIVKYFDPSLIFIFSDKKGHVENVIGKINVSFVLDDRPEESEVWKRNGVKAVRVRRGRYSELELSHESQVTEVENLEQISL